MGPLSGFSGYLQVPDIPAVEQDKISCNAGRSASKSCFENKDKVQLEATLHCVDQASHFRLKCTAYLCSSLEYLKRAYKDNSPVSPDFTALALHGLDEGLNSSFKQFTRISILSMQTWRSNAIDVMNPSRTSK